MVAEEEHAGFWTINTMFYIVYGLYKAGDNYNLHLSTNHSKYSGHHGHKISIWTSLGHKGLQSQII